MQDNKMPEKIYAYRCSQGYVQAGERKSNIVKTTKYTLSSLCVPRSEYDKLKQQADRLVEALELATDQLEKTVLGDRIDTKVVNKILDKEALAEYRKETE